MSKIKKGEAVVPELLIDQGYTCFDIEDRVIGPYVIRGLEPKTRYFIDTIEMCYYRSDGTNYLGERLFDKFPIVEY